MHCTKQNIANCSINFIKDVDVFPDWPADENELAVVFVEDHIRGLRHSYVA